MRAALERANLSGDRVDLALMGHVLSAGVGQGPARQAALGAGIPERVPAVTLSKVCGSGMESVIAAVRAVRLGDAQLVVAGGMESMSNAPYLLPQARTGMRLGDAVVVDSIMRDGLVNVYDSRAMGALSEGVATRFGINREAQDSYAIASYERARAATAAGVAAQEIVTTQVPGPKGATLEVAHDEGPRRFDPEKMLRLRPAFVEGGTITAANASSINDGAAALVVADEAHARALGLPILARILGYAGHALTPADFAAAPIGAMGKLYAQLGIDPGDVDVYEINEAFAVVPLAAMQAFGLPHDRVNLLGGAVSLGHPIGASGARILVTLLNALRQQGGTLGMASICIGGGEALAMAVERV
jgi:acetyl-CoA C-acetyltransferase